MSSGKTSRVKKNLRTFNSRIPANLEREQVGLAKTLRKGRFQKEPFKALEVLYGLLDRFYSYSTGLVACKKGCSYCCHMQIRLSQIEADFISSKIGISAKKLRASTEIDPSSWVNPSNPCPFLRANECSIYSCRPMTCRTHVSLEETAEKCGFGSKAIISMVNRDTSLPGAMQAYKEMTIRYGGHNADIRDFFGGSEFLLFSAGTLNTEGQ